MVDLGCGYLMRFLARVADSPSDLHSHCLLKPKIGCFDVVLSWLIEITANRGLMPVRSLCIWEEIEGFITFDTLTDIFQNSSINRKIWRISYETSTQGPYSGLRIKVVFNSSPFVQGTERFGFQFIYNGCKYSITPNFCGLMTSTGSLEPVPLQKPSNR